MATMYDSSIYISALRSGDLDILGGRWLGESPVWLSSVVMEELYAGAKPGDLHILEKLERDLANANRILIPNLGDWTRSGRILARVGQKYGYEKIGRARLVNDALIATSAARAGITLLTANRRDFELLSEFCALQWKTNSVH